MDVLVILNSTAILAWLAGETVESAPAHIAGGYPHLQAEWDAETVQATVISAEPADAFRPDLFEGP